MTTLKLAGSEVMRNSDAGRNNVQHDATAN